LFNRLIFSNNILLSKFSISDRLF
jgi:hypothetical protein